MLTKMSRITWEEIKPLLDFGLKAFSDIMTLKCEAIKTNF